jgi:heterodisulfide reductase subunit C2
MTKVNPKFIDEFNGSDEFNAVACMNCGTCTGLCPIGLDILPRELFRYVMLGLEDKVLENLETIYTCLLCKMCEENCPSEVHIAENVRALRAYINKNVFKL